MQKMLLVGAWFFGVIFIAGSLGALLEGSLIAGLLMLIGGILLLPPVKRLILDKKPKLNRGKITAVGSILIFISMFFVSTDDEIKADGNENQDLTSESAAETKPAVVEPEPTPEVVEKKEPVEVTPIPVENKPVEVIQAAPSKPSITEKKQDIDTVKARAILDKIDEEVKEAKGFDLGNGAEIAKKSRRMKALDEDMTALTEDMPPIGRENGNIGFFCGLASGEGFGYWRNVMSINQDPQVSNDLLKSYQESKGSCLDAIEDFENS